ncbi:hypothetical protein [Streptomyces sp. NPDC046712]|uniref:hypothetical protein n=1 Tax=Streptomyces sp. NPDC046712 TaxID=3154802 RepID=UPI0033CD299A
MSSEHMSSGGMSSHGKGPDHEGPDDMEREMVNDGPENDAPGTEKAPDGRPGGDAPLAGDTSGDASEAASGDAFGDAFGGDELALRRLLHGAVADLQPSEGALDHLRQAVPVRRTRKRQAIVGFAAAAVLIGTSVPAFVHVANSGGITADQAVNAGHGEQAQGGTGSETGVEGGGKGTGTPSGTAAPSQGAAAGAGDAKDSANGSTGTGSKPAAGSSPACEAGQLAVSSVQAGGPDAEGKVYGTFRIANVSGTDCVVTGDGSVGFQALGAANPSRISVVAHTAGDAASGLPDPSQESPTLVLQPDNAYEVKFAWVPTETCPTTGTSPDPGTDPGPDPSPTPDPNPTPSPTKDGDGTSTGSTGAGTGGGTTDGTAPQLVRDGTPADGSITVSHTAEAGAPQAATTIPNACAGTIYRTGVLDAS